MCISTMISLYGSQSRSLNVGAFGLRFVGSESEDVISMCDCPNDKADDGGICGFDVAERTQTLQQIQGQR